MNQSELSSVVAADTDLSTAGAARVVAAVVSAIVHELELGGEVRLQGFGGFSVTTTAAREGRNPQTGEKVKIPAKRRARFKEAQALKETLNPVRLTGARRRVG